MDSDADPKTSVTLQDGQDIVITVTGGVETYIMEIEFVAKNVDAIDVVYLQRNRPDTPIDNSVSVLFIIFLLQNFMDE